MSDPDGRDGRDGQTWQFESFYHTIINARDADETIAFYELLGFEILDDRRDASWPDGQGAFFGLTPNIKGRGALMRLPSDPNGPMLDIIEWQVPRVEFPARSLHVVPRVLATAPLEDRKGVQRGLGPIARASIRELQMPQPGL